MQFPDIQVKRGARFVEAGNLASAGGLSIGIDLALRVVGRYFGSRGRREEPLTTWNIRVKADRPQFEPGLPRESGIHRSASAVSGVRDGS